MGQGWNRAATLKGVAALAVVAVALAWTLTARGQTPARAQAPTQASTASRVSRIAGHPNLTGLWQAMNSANWDLEAHPARSAPIVAMGAVGAIPAGQSVVEGGTIPYKPEALAKKKANGEKWLTEDPEVKCYMPGIPRANYQDHPFQIVEGTNTILFAYEFGAATRIVYMKDHRESPVDQWMGWSNGHWEGDT